MTLTQDTRTTGTLSQDNRASLGILSQASRTLGTLTQNNVATVGTLTQNTKPTAGYLWSSTIFPWISTFYPWVWSGNGQLIIQDIRS